MSEKGGKKKTIKNNKKASKDKKPITLKLNNGAEIPARGIYKEDSRAFNINDIDINKIKVSDKKLYNKKHDSYKHYVFYEDDEIDVPGYYNIFNEDSKTMNFKFDDDLLRKIIDIFEHIGEILNINPYHYLHDDNKGVTYLKQKYLIKHVLEKTRIKQLIQFQMKRLSKYNCRVLLQIQSVYYNDKSIIEDEDYYPQVFLQHCRYTFFANNKLIHEALDFTDSEPESESEEEEFNEYNCVMT